MGPLPGTKWDPSLGQTGLSLLSSTVKSPFCPVCPWDGWGFVPGTIAPQGPPEKCLCVFCLLVFFAPLLLIHSNEPMQGGQGRECTKDPPLGTLCAGQNMQRRWQMLHYLHEQRISKPLQTRVRKYLFEVRMLAVDIYIYIEQRLFDANNAKTEMCHFCLKCYKTRCTPVKRDRIQNPRHGPHPE